MSTFAHDALDIVADTSVVINLNATGHSESILAALPNRVVVVDEVVQELKEDRRNRRNDGQALAALVSAGALEIVRLGDSGQQHFMDLVSGAASESLDDGEAATIAFALEKNIAALIDERKANRICRERFAGLSVGNTIDVLAHENVQADLGRDRLAEAVFNALYYSRMRILPEHVEWVVGLIGTERATACCSLPRSASRQALSKK